MLAIGTNNQLDNEIHIIITDRKPFLISDGSSSLLVVKSVIMNKIRKRYFIVNNLIYSDILSV